MKNLILIRKTKSKIIYLIIITILGISAPINSQELILGIKENIYSNILKENRVYYISKPHNFNSNQAYSVLYVLDGDEMFNLAASTVHFLTNRGFMPPTIVIGINNTKNRGRDLTPTKTNWVPNGGGAKNFLSFLTKELIPEVENKFKTQPHKTLYGSSLGGLFTLYALYNLPNEFDNYIAISPSLYHDNGILFKHALSFFKSKKDQKNKFVFLSLADEVYSEMRIQYRNTIDLFKNKANSKNIRWKYKVYDKETHETSKLIGLNDGLRQLHQFWYVPFYQRDRGAEGLIEHYSLLNQLYNFNEEIKIPETLSNKIGHNILREGKPKMALSLFKYNIANYPKSPTAHNSLGKYYEREKKYKEANKYYRLAIEKAKALKKNYDIYEQNFLRVSNYLNSKR